METKALQKLTRELDISSRELKSLLEGAEKTAFIPGQIIVHEGETNSNLYLLTEGVWRAYSFKDGAEVTLWFATAGEFAFSAWGYAAGAPSLLTLEALTAGEAYCLSKSHMEQRFLASVALANLGRRILEKFVLAGESLWLASYRRTAMERYVALLEKQPEIVQSVPLKYIASYLGITVQSLSRIRMRLAKYGCGLPR